MMYQETHSDRRLQERRSSGILHQRWHLLLCALSVFICLSTVTYEAKAQDAPKEQNTQEVGAQAPNIATPSADTILIMIRTSLLSLYDGVVTGNYTVFRDLASPSFRDANSAGRLHEIFSNLASKPINIAAVAIIPPKLTQTPFVDENKRLHIVGYFPGNPVQLKFELVFEIVGRRWRLFGISADVVNAEVAEAAPQAEQKDKKKPAPGSAGAKSSSNKPGK
jgi:hypothetical protein